MIKSTLLFIGFLVCISACNQDRTEKLSIDISSINNSEDSTLTIIRNAADSNYILLKFYPDLKIRELTEFKDGKENGKNIMWRQNESIWVDRYLREGKMNGVVREFRPNGRTGFEGERINYEFEGINNSFYESGAIEKRWTRKNGKDLGKVIYYYENGLIKEIGENTDDGYRILKSYNSINDTTIGKI